MTQTAASQTAEYVHLHQPYTGKWTACEINPDLIYRDETTERLNEVTCPRCKYEGDPVPRTRNLTIEEARTDALKIDKGYPSGQAQQWRERTYRRAVELNAAAPHMGHAHDSLIDEAHTEALGMNAEDTMPAPEIVIPASGKTPYCATCCVDLGEDHDAWCAGTGVVALKTATQEDPMSTTATPFVSVGTDPDTGRAIIALDAAAVDALTGILDDLVNSDDFLYPEDGDTVYTADRSAVAHAILRPLLKLQGF